MTEEERKELKQLYFDKALLITQIFGDEFISKVRNAFANNEYPGDENLISSPEHLAECYECRGYCEFFVGKTWEECLEIDSYGKLGGGQSFFKPLAWHYYLPAYLILSVGKMRFSSSNFREPTYYVKDYYSIEEYEEFRNNFEQPRIDALTKDQCEVIISYLELVDKREETFDEFEREYTQKTLIYWKDNYQKAMAKEQNL